MEKETVQREYGITDRTKSLRAGGVQKQETGQSLVLSKNTFLEESLTCDFISCSFSFI